MFEVLGSLYMLYTFPDRPRTSRTRSGASPWPSRKPLRRRSSKIQDLAGQRSSRETEREREMPFFLFGGGGRLLRRCLLLREGAWGFPSGRSGTTVCPGCQALHRKRVPPALWRRPGALRSRVERYIIYIYIYIHVHMHMHMHIHI